MKVSFWNIYFLFFKIGAVLLGGGYVLLPLLLSEVVEKRNWLTKEELIDYYAISQCLPGIIAVNTCTFAGYKLKGKSGAIAAITGMCTTPFLAILLVSTILSRLVSFDIVKNMFWGIGIGIIVMIFLTIKEIWSKSIVDKFTLLLFLFVFFLTVLFNISPVWSVLGSAVIGIIYKSFNRGDNVL